MTFTYLCFINKNLVEKLPDILRAILSALALVVFISPPSLAHTDALVTQVKGEATIKLPGFPKKTQVQPGTFLSEKVELQLNGAKSHISVLCPGLETIVNINAAEQSKRLCPPRESSKMRGGDDNETPFILLPNQAALSEINRVLWSGPKKAEYLIMLFQYDEYGSEVLIKEWSTETRIYHNSGFHELQLTSSFPLSFPNDKKVTYKLEIENIDTRQSSASFDEILIKPINRRFPENLLKEGLSLLESQHIEANSPLGNLILASYLQGKGQMSEAYSIASTLTTSTYKTAAQLLMAKALYLPGIPEDIVVREFGNILKLAVADDDIPNAIIACEGLLSPSNNLLSEDVRKLRNNIVKTPEYTRLCVKQ